MKHMKHEFGTPRTIRFPINHKTTQLQKQRCTFCGYGILRTLISERVFCDFYCMDAWVNEDYPNRIQVIKGW